VQEGKLLDPTELLDLGGWTMMARRAQGSTSLPEQQP
jgi:hypothetical protein